MFNLFENIVQKRRYLIVDEANVMTVLKVLDDIKHVSKFYYAKVMEIGNCHWANDPEAWFIHFEATSGQWRKMIAVLKEQGYTLILDHREEFHVKKGAEGQK